MVEELKAVFLDLDDTLVLTTRAGQEALKEVAKCAEAIVPGLEGTALTEQWEELFKEQPWDPEGKVDVTLWRALLWGKAARALEYRGDTSGALQTSASDLPQASPQRASFARDSAASVCERTFLDGSACLQLQRCYDDVRMAGFRLEACVPELMRFLGEVGLACVIITNGHASIQRTKLKTCGASQYFKHVLVGGEEVAAGRKEKPAASIFLRACSMVGCRPSEAIHVGDSLSADIRGANDAKLRSSVWVNSSGDPPSANAPVPTHTISHISELQALLRAKLTCGAGTSA